MAFPILQVGAVLTNIICTKVSIPTRPNCYKENFGQFPHKFKCCPFNNVFVNHGRICACVPPQYGRKLFDIIKFSGGHVNFVLYV